MIGIAGTDEKCAYVVDELGAEACINYRTDDLPSRLKELCPKGLDVYFDNVGGPILDAALGRLAIGAWRCAGPSPPTTRCASRPVPPTT